MVCGISPCRRYRLLLCVLAGIQFLSCDTLSLNQRLYVAIDVAPERLRANAEFIDHVLLRWFDERGRHRHRVIMATQLPIASATDSIKSGISISVSARGQTPILLTPIAINGTRFSPAAAIFPITDANTSVVTLEWESGCAIEVLFRAFPHTDGLHGFNSRRYLQEVAARDTPNPCWIDDDGLSALLRERTLRITAIRDRPVYPVGILLPAGRWDSSNIFYPSLHSDGIVRQRMEIPYGIFHLFDVEHGRYIRIYFDAREVIMGQTELLNVR